MRLCSVCESKLLPGDLCPVCKTICRNPIVISDSIRLNASHTGDDKGCEFHKNDRKTPYMNMRHPENEEECSYHDDTHLDTIHDLIRQRKPRNTVRHRNAKREVKIGSIITVIFFIIILASVLPYLLLYLLA